MIRSLGLRYKKIYACDMLFWKPNTKVESCMICGESTCKWVEDQKANRATLGKSGNKIPRKFLR